MLDYHFGDRLPVLDHGHVALLDVMGNDDAIVDAARISYDAPGRDKEKNRALIRYLLRHRHTSPFEMAELKFELKMPIFVARQWVRHRTASMNEQSARYTQLPAEMFVPEEIAVQSTDNKQGRTTETAGDRNLLRGMIEENNDAAYNTYEELLSQGVTRELARGALPLNIYTKFVWKMDLHNLMHFLKLRLDPHAQKEIREYAEVIAKLVNLYFPITYEAFVDYQRDAYLCSRMEVEVLRELLAMYQHFSTGKSTPDETRVALEKIDAEAGETMSDRELKEFREKFLHG